MSPSGLAAHLSPAELGQRYRAARSPIERSHLQIVWLLSRGRSEREGAQVPGYGRRWVGEVARRYEEGGPDGLGDRRRGNAGARPLLGAEDEAALRAALAEPPAAGGLGTGPKGGRGGGAGARARVGGAPRRARRGGRHRGRANRKRPGPAPARPRRPPPRGGSPE